MIMEKKAYELIENFEDWFCWNRARKNIITDTIINNIDDFKIKKLLDIGCCSGDFLSSISKYIPNCMEIEGYKYNHKKYDNIKICNIFDNGLEEHSFDIITALDVMEHIESENSFLNEIKRLSNGKCILLTVLSYQFLFTYHDEINNHYRRYNKNRLRKVLLENSFEVIKISYCNFFLFTPFFIVRRMIDKIFNLKRIQKEKRVFLMNFYLKYLILRNTYLEKLIYLLDLV